MKYVGVDLHKKVITVCVVIRSNNGLLNGGLVNRNVQGCLNRLTRFLHLT
jgi:hypothetical protein